MWKKIFLKIFGGCNDGIHDFQNFLVRQRPIGDLGEIRGCMSTGMMEVLMQSVVEKEYEIRCQRCGCKPQ